MSGVNGGFSNVAWQSHDASACLAAPAYSPYLQFGDAQLRRRRHPVFAEQHRRAGLRAGARPFSLHTRRRVAVVRAQQNPRSRPTTPRIGGSLSRRIPRTSISVDQSAGVAIAISSAGLSEFVPGTAIGARRSAARTAPPISNHFIDVGADGGYGRSYALTRRTTFSFSTNSGLFVARAHDASARRLVRPADARVRRRIGGLDSHAWVVRGPPASGYSAERLVRGGLRPATAQRHRASGRWAGSSRRGSTSTPVRSTPPVSVGFSGDDNGFATSSAVASLRFAHLAPPGGRTPSISITTTCFEQGVTLPGYLPPNLDRQGRIGRLDRLAATDWIARTSMIPGKKYTPDEIAAILWRWKWLIVLPCVVGAVGAFAYARTLKDLYRSEAVIMMTPQRVREDLVRSTVRSTLAERIQTISQQIMSRTRLESIVVDLNLYPEQRRTGLMEDVVERMRRDVSVQTVRGDAFRVAYVSESPDHRHAGRRTAGRAVHRREPEGPRADGAGHQPVPRVAARGRASAPRGAGKAPRGVPPRATPASCPRRCSRTWRPSTARSCRCNGCRTRSPGTATSCSCSSGRSPTSTSPKRSPQSPCSTRRAPRCREAPPAQQLEAARAALRNLELRLKPEHPDIAPDASAHHDARAEGRERGARSAADGRRLGAASHQGRDRPGDSTSRDGADRPNASASRSPPRRPSRTAFARTVGAYQQRLDAAPTRETELIELTRDYDTMQRLYASLLGKSEESKLSRQPRGAPGGPAVQDPRAGHVCRHARSAPTATGCTRWARFGGAGAGPRPGLPDRLSRQQPQDRRRRHRVAGPAGAGAGADDADHAQTGAGFAAGDFSLAAPARLS